MNNKKIVILFDEENKTLYQENITEITDNKIETKTNLYPKKDFTTYFDESNNTLAYLSNIDLSAKIETENLKQLRRSAALNNIFDYETTKDFDLMAYMPYIIIIVMAIFM